MKANVLTIPAGAPFADTLARGLIARLGADRDALALSRATIYLPTRRATRTLAESFARLLGGAALLPDIRPLGDVDEDDFLFDPSSENLDLPPAIAPVRRQLLLAALVQRWDQRRGGKLTFAQAAALARGLAAFLDEAETQNADLLKLDELAPASMAEHWAEVKDFLILLRDQWPGLLMAENAMNRAAHRNASLAALARRLAEHPPAGPIIAAGSTGSIPATAELLGVIARLPDGAVVLPGLDRELDKESWAQLDPGHPQYGMKQLLERIGVARGDVADWTDAPPIREREKLLREALRPAPTTDAWRAIADHCEDIAQGLEGLSLVEAAHSGEEAASIALMLREALETPMRTAALVTPDRNLARRVAAELRRWNIEIDDSAGRPLSHTPPGTILCLLAEAADAGFKPVPLLVLLKHPLAAGGEAPAVFRSRVRELDRLCLRGPHRDGGIAGIATAIARAEIEAREASQKKIIAELATWFSRLAKTLRPLEDALRRRDVVIADIVALHAKVAEDLATTGDEPGSARLWKSDAGIAAADMIAEISEAATDLPRIDTASYGALFGELAAERTVRSTFGRHPRLAILGPLEARLQSFDLIVLGGLNEGTWPAAATTDAWLSRPMRKTLGLEQPERAIGLSAHDFAMLAAAPRVILTRALKSEGSPTIASRWLQRLLQLTRGLKLDGKLAAQAPYAAYAAALDAAARPAERIARPAPRPPVAARPRKLSVTEIETWLRDPYAIYAKHVLRLRPLKPLDADIGPLERGSAIHLALERFVARVVERLPDDAELQLLAIADDVFLETGTSAATLALWRPRFIHAVHYFVEIERERRRNIVRSHLEIRGERIFAGPRGNFTLFGYADRIDELKSGGAAIVDYKTGKPPSGKQIAAMLSPQLPLEGAILLAGGFKAPGKLTPQELLYIHFAGTKEPVESMPVKGDAAALSLEAAEKLADRIAYFDSESTPYHSRVKVEKARWQGDYDHLARVREWSLTGWEESEE